jgi:hypothetical protein
MNDLARAAVSQIAASTKLPCSTFVAIWALAKQGKIPSNPLSLSAWRALDPTFYSAVNIEDHSDLWSNIPALQRALGGSYFSTGKVSSSNPAPALEAGKWHIVQRWCGSSGHAYLVYAEGNGSYRIIDSNTNRGLKSATTNKWYTSGCEHAVLTLPSSSGIIKKVAIGAGVGIGSLALLGLIAAIVRKK